MAITWTGKISNPKSESPNLKQPRSPKFQKKTRNAPCTVLVIGLREFGFVWDLGFPACVAKALASRSPPFTIHQSLSTGSRRLPLQKLGWWNWQTRTFEGRMPKGLRVQVPPRARFSNGNVEALERPNFTLRRLNVLTRSLN